MRLQRVSFKFASKQTNVALQAFVTVEDKNHNIAESKPVSISVARRVGGFPALVTYNKASALLCWACVTHVISNAQKIGPQHTVKIKNKAEHNYFQY